MKVSITIAAVVGVLVLLSFRPHTRSTLPHERLSDYGFFQSPLAALKPVEGVLRYDLNAPLFSNYAEKLRFVKIPAGTKVVYNDSVALTFPVGTTLIKNFYFPLDFRRPGSGRRLVETRLLIRGDDGWEAFPYVWNTEQTEALYEPAGAQLSLNYIGAKGRKVVTPYLVPNKNQCKSCHVRGQSLMPIGPSARQLNREVKYENGDENQLKHWERMGWLDGFVGASPAMADYLDPEADINLRARSYLDSNCGHCHNRLGPASTSGLYLDIGEKDPGHLGILKSPVAAGRGAGKLPYDIVPGDPGKSIMVYRMKTNDPGIAMPEVGREQLHKEGIEIIEHWIRQLPQ